MNTLGYLQSLGSLTQSVPTNLGAITSTQSNTNAKQELKGITNMPTLFQSIANNNTSQGINNLLYQYFPCKHQTVVTFQKCQFCKECGVRIYKNGQLLALKTPQMKYLVNISPIRLYKNTYKKPKNQINLQQHQDYLKQREQTINFIIDLADRMRLTKQTAFLSIMLLDLLVVNDKVSKLCSFNVKEHLQVFGGVCVMLAAKTIELDERIPFLSTLKKYIQLNQYSKEDLRKAEQKTVDILKFNMQLPTLFDLLEYYGSQGIVFSNDTLKNNTPVFTQQTAPFSLQSKEYAKGHIVKKEKFVSHRTVELEFQHTLSYQPNIYQQQQQSDSTKNSSLNLNDYSSTQDTSSKNSNNDDHPSYSPPSHSIPEVQPILNKDLEITPFKFYDIVYKMERDFSRLVFYAIKDERFYEQDLEILGAACACYLREKYNISNPYREEIIQMCNQDRSMVLASSLTFLSKFDPYFKTGNSFNGQSTTNLFNEIRTNIKQGLYNNDNCKSTTNLTTSVRILQENKKPQVENIDVNSTRVREKSFEKLGIFSQTSRNATTTTTTNTQQLTKNTIGAQSSRNFILDQIKPELKQNIINTNVSKINTTNPVISQNIQSGVSQPVPLTISQNFVSSVSSTQNKPIQQQTTFNQTQSLPQNQQSTSQAIPSKISSTSNTFSKPFMTTQNEFPSKTYLPKTTLPSNHLSSNLPKFEDEANWNSHFNKTINAINLRANAFSTQTNLRRNQF